MAPQSILVKHAPIECLKHILEALGLADVPPMRNQNQHVLNTSDAAWWESGDVEVFADHGYGVSVSAPEDDPIHAKVDEIMSVHTPPWYDGRDGDAAQWDASNRVSRVLRAGASFDQAVLACLPTERADSPLRDDAFVRSLRAYFEDPSHRLGTD